MSTGKGKRKIDWEEERVDNLLEEHSVPLKNPKVVIDVLNEHEKTEHSLTRASWQEFIKKHQQVFKKYYPRLPKTNAHNPPPVKFEAGPSTSLKILSAAERRRGLALQIERVKNQIDLCLMQYMNLKQVIDVLYRKEKITPAFTKIVWKELKEQNQNFFKNYYSRLAVKDQIIRFNDILEKHACPILWPNPNNEPETNGRGVRIFGVQLQAPSDHQSTYEPETNERGVRIFGVQLQAPSDHQSTSHKQQQLPQ